MYNQNKTLYNINIKNIINISTFAIFQQPQTLQSFLCLLLHLYMTQGVTALQNQFKPHEISSWLSYAVW